MSVEEEVAVLESQHQWDRLFREVKATSAQNDYSYKAAKSPENRDRNRYRDVSPYDHSRVALSGENDYINGSLVEVKKANRRYILTQGPLPGTSGHLWQMVWEQNSKSVIMLNKTVEKGTRKCHQYWPINEDHPMSYTEVGYKVSLKHETDKDNFIIRELQLTNLTTNETRTIYQFHYIAWPDFGVPASPTAFLDFLKCVRDYAVLENDNGPAVIHCSAGIGRSGTFILVDTCLEFLIKGVPFDVKQTLLEMRNYRMGLIQTPLQLRFSYFAIAECERILQFKKGEEDTTDESTVDSETEDENDHQPPPSSNGDFGEEKPEHGDKGGSNQESHETKDNRKRHGEPNGPKDEKRGKVDSLTINSDKDTKLENEAFLHAIDNNNVKKDTRQRKKEGRAARIEEIKRNMKSCEKRWPWKKYVIGGVLTSVVIGLALRWWFSG